MLASTEAATGPTSTGGGSLSPGNRRIGFASSAPFTPRGREPMERLLEPSSFTEKDVEQSIGTRFEEMVARFPRRIAVVDKGRELSYEQLNARANQIAR